MVPLLQQSTQRTCKPLVSLEPSHIINNVMRSIGDLINEQFGSNKEEKYVLCSRCQLPFITTVFTFGSMVSHEQFCEGCRYALNSCEVCSKALTKVYHMGNLIQICENYSLPCSRAIMERSERETDRKVQRERYMKEYLPEVFYMSESFDATKLPPDIRETFFTLSHTLYDLVIDGHGGMIVGPTGRAKTRLMYTVLQRLYIERNKSIKLFSGPQLHNLISEAYSSLESERGLVWEKSLYDCDVLAIDDFGKGHFTQRVLSSLFSIVDYRTNHRKPILITSNDTQRTIESKTKSSDVVLILGPIYRRLSETSEIINL